MSAARILRRALGRGTLAALALTAASALTAGALRAQDEPAEIEYDSRGKPIRKPGGYRTPVSNATDGRTEYCFGGVGPGCAGAPGSPNGWSSSNNRVMMYVSVGSILHDNCCLREPQGKFCGGVGADGTGKAWEFNHNGKCVKEWDKAWWNTLDNRQWRVPVDHKQPSDIMRTAGRPAVLKDGTPVTREETNASRQYSAPAGVALDVGDQAFCASGRAEERSAVTGVRWIVCQ